MNSLEERMWVIVVEIVPAAGQFRKSDSFDALRQRLAVRDWNDRILISPEEGDRGQLCDFVRMEIKRVALTPPIHETAHRPREGARSPAARIHRAQLGDVTDWKLVAPRPQGQTRSEGHQRLPKALDNARNGREAQEENDLFAQTTRRSQDQATNTRAADFQEHQRDASTKGVADDIHPLSWL
jgi:hypothetical protein